MPRLMDIYNYEVLHGTATFDIHPKDLSERMVWFQEHQERNHPLIVAEMEDGRVAGYASLHPTGKKRLTQQPQSFPCICCGMPRKRSGFCLDSGNPSPGKRGNGALYGDFCNYGRQ